MFKKGYHYYNNGIKEVFCENCPEGFSSGRLPSVRDKIKKSKKEKPILGCSEEKRKHLQKITKEKSDKYLKELINKISKEDLYSYYIKENHSYYESINYFNITEHAFIKLCKEYNIPKKDKSKAKSLALLNSYKKWGSKEAFIEQQQEKFRNTCQERYGVSNPNQIPEVREKIRKTCLEKYGVEDVSRLKSFREKSKHSQPNENFEKLLILNNIKDYNREFRLNNRWYDFKVKNYLIEIDPTITHNSTFNVYGEAPLDKNYHSNKSKLAQENGYQCIHIFDWDDKDKIVNILKERETIYARKCVIKEINKTDSIKFINEYHLQNYARDKIRLGLYYNNELVSIMTFGKPRYNKKYEWEIIRYCSSKNVIGGAQKLFKHFIRDYSPKSIISYCDRSKFSGQVYTDLGMVKIKSYNNINKHWYNMITKIHITNNLLLQQGFDRLFKTNYGKGTSNEELMLQNGFVEVYDCGQDVYEWKAN